jgi:hypothetical protein
LRNGHLNQAAYSLFLFIRDLADGDLIGWIDAQLQTANSPAGPDRLTRMAAALLEPMREIYGVSDKVLAMALSSLLLGTPEKMGRAPRQPVRRTGRQPGDRSPVVRRRHLQYDRDHRRSLRYW